MASSDGKKGLAALEQSSKPYDLEARTFQFARNVIQLANGLPRTLANIEIAKQVIRSSGSVGANYIEAKEGLSRKDFAMRAKICRKEARETGYWLKLCAPANEDGQKVMQTLIGEAEELTRIFSAIVDKTAEPEK